MAYIGAFGTLAFIVSHNKVLTFSEIKETVKGRWANHEPINGAVISEFLGPGQEEKTFTIIFSQALGVDPEQSFRELRALARSGEHFPIVIGGTPLGDCDWYVGDAASTAERFAGDGTALWRECQVTVKEYL